MVFRYFNVLTSNMMTLVLFRYVKVVLMGNNRTRFVVLLLIFVLMVLGCGREIGEVTVGVVPSAGCVPLHVELVGKADVQEGIRPEFRWTIGGDVQLHGPNVQHTFNTPATYAISLTVVGEKHEKTTTASIDVRAAEMPTVPGLYLRQGCAYQAVPSVEVAKEIKQLGKTSLEDLEQRIEGRSLSTLELVTHPLWRREHTHTVHTIARDRFVAVRLMMFKLSDGWGSARRGVRSPCSRFFPARSRCQLRKSRSSYAWWIRGVSTMSIRNRRR